MSRTSLQTTDHDYTM